MSCEDFIKNMKEIIQKEGASSPGWDQSKKRDGAARKMYKITSPMKDHRIFTFSNVNECDTFALFQFM